MGETVLIILLAVFVVLFFGVVILFINQKLKWSSLEAELNKKLHTTETEHQNFRQLNENLKSELNEFKQLNTSSTERILTVEKDFAALKQKYENLDEKHDNKCKEAEGLLEKFEKIAEAHQIGQRDNSALLEKNKAMQEKHQQLQTEITQMHKKLQKDFEILANKVIDTTSKKFNESSQKELKHILQPLKQRIETFEGKVEKVHSETKDYQSTLKERIKTISEMHQAIHKDAQDLTNALRGRGKVQGDWGEMALETILENAGLHRDVNYFIQKTFRDDDEQLKKPDFIIKMPDDRAVVIDSKVSLTDFIRYNKCEDEEDRKRHLKAHLNSVRSHIKSIDQKKYADIKGTYDYVLMFIPVEGAFTLALQADQGLYQEAFNKKIVLISPTNIFLAIQLIADVWDKDRQNKNVQKIVEEAAKLRDKFFKFYNELEKAEKHINQTQKILGESKQRLMYGRGNLVGKVVKLQKLGARGKKQIPDSVKLLLEEE